MIMRIIPSSIIVAVALTGTAADLRAQSLAQIAEAETARRQSTKAAVKVYTNDDLGGTAAAPPPPPPAPAATAPKADQAAVKDGQKPAPDEKKTEKYWKDRATALQQSLSRNKILLDALQSQVNGLNAQYLSMDDPGQRGLLEKRIQTASGEMQRVQQDIEKQKQAAAALEDEARKAGVPSGWVR